MRTTRLVGAVVLVLVGCEPAASSGGTPVLPLRDVALGSSEACAIDALGEVWCWGDAASFRGELSMTGADNTCVAPFVSAGIPSVSRASWEMPRAGTR